MSSQRWPSLGSCCWRRGPAILCCWPPSPWSQGFLVLLKQRACAFTHMNCTHLRGLLEHCLWPSVERTGRDRMLNCPQPGAGKLLTSSLPLVICTVCSGLLYPLSHPVRYVAVDQVESFQHAGLSATSPSARRPHQGAAAQRGSTSPAPPDCSHLLAWKQRAAASQNTSLGHQCCPLHFIQATLQPPSNKLRP